jgi:SAM-dependent methyltransferase
VDDFDRYAPFYDRDLDGFADDVQMVEQFALRTGSPILDLGCGTGRLLVPLAREGYQLTGVDISAAMLDVARGNLATAGVGEQVCLVQQDMRHLDLGQTYRLIVCALSSFAHLLTQEDQRTALTRVREHLCPGGLLVLDMFNPDLPGTGAAEGQVVLDKSWTDPDSGRLVLKFVTRQVNWATQVQQVTFILDEMDGQGGVRRTVFPFGMRFLYRAEAELMLQSAGLRLESVYGSYDLAEHAQDSPNLILVASRP